jgi:hypothetical protein
MHFKAVALPLKATTFIPNHSESYPATYVYHHFCALFYALLISSYKCIIIYSFYSYFLQWVLLERQRIKVKRVYSIYFDLYGMTCDKQWLLRLYNEITSKTH